MVKLTSRAFISVLAAGVFSLNAHAEQYLGDVAPGKLYLFGYTGTDLLGRADLIIPFLQKDDRNFFVYGQSRVSNNEEGSVNNNDVTQDLFNATPWTVSGGLGYRQVVKGSALLGGFVLADLSQSGSEGRYFWDVSPGVEALGKVWDFRANGYFPVSDKRWEKQGFADQFHINDFVTFAGHQQFDQFIAMKHFEEIAPGGDAEVGRKLFKVNNVLVKGYFGGYYFDMKDNGGVTGGSARITIQPSEFVEFSANDTYDHVQHNVFMLGMRLRLNDIFSSHPQHDVIEDQDLSARLLDPVERNVGNLGSGGSVPAAHGKITFQGQQLERDHIWFFDGTKTANGTGTFEDPYSFLQYQQTTFDSIHGVNPDFANMYFNHGTYQSTAIINPRATANPSLISLYANQAMWGRMGAQNGFADPASGDNRPIFIGGLQLASNTSLNDQILQNKSGLPVGVTINDAQDVVLNDVNIGAEKDSVNGYQTGINISNSSGLSFTNSNIFGYNNTNLGTSADNAFGIKINNNVNIIAITHTTIEGTSVNRSAFGLFEQTTGTVNIGVIDKATFIGNGHSIGNGVDFELNPTLSIGSIVDSNFQGNGGTIFGFGANIEASAVTIGNISGSSFIGNGGPSTAVGCAISTDSGSINIGDITGSQFIGQNSNDSVGLSLNTTSGSIQVGNITNLSSFVGNGGVGDGVGFSAFSTSGGIVLGRTLNGVTGSTFTGIGVLSGYSIKLSTAGAIKVSTKPYADGPTLKNDLTDISKTNPIDTLNGQVCVKGICS